MMLWRMLHALAAAFTAALLLAVIALRAIDLWRREHRRLVAFRAGLRILATCEDIRPHLRVVRPQPRCGLLSRARQLLQVHGVGVAAAYVVLTVLGATSVLLVAQREPAAGAAPEPVVPMPRPAQAPVTVTVTVTALPPRPAPAGVAPALPAPAPVPPADVTTALPASASALPSSTSSSPAAPRKRRPPQPSTNPQSAPAPPPSDQPTMDAAPACLSVCMSVTLLAP